MKKIMFFLAVILIAFSVSACTSKTATTDEEKTPPLTATADENKNLVDDIIPSTPVGSIIQTTASEVPVQNTTTMLSLDKQEDLTKTYSQAIIKTSLGNITVKFYASDSPMTVNNFLNLAKEGFYNGTKFHRVIKDFMIQGGDPLSKEADASVWGTGGPGYQFKDEINSHKLVLGSLAMANAGPGTNGSQFFIVTLPETPWLDGRHTNFGEVVSGMDVVKKIEAVSTGINDRPVTDVVVNSVELVK